VVSGLAPETGASVRCLCYFGSHISLHLVTKFGVTPNLARETRALPVNKTATPSQNYHSISSFLIQGQNLETGATPVLRLKLFCHSNDGQTHSIGHWDFITFHHGVTE
jgi:hypothetical protein